MKIVLLSFLVIVLSEAVTYKDVFQEEWQVFKVQHSKQYKDVTEEQFRLKIYLENRHKIARHNQRFEKGLHKYRLKMNKYGDLLHHEFVKVMNGFKRRYRNLTLESNSATTYLSPANVLIPRDVDWRKHGYVTPVKDQGQCGSCWSFSTTGALEGQHFRKTKKLVSLSEQNLIDCSTKYGNEGCNGGLMDQAFDYIKDNHGIDTELSYPYEGKDDVCRFSKKKVGATDTGYVDLPQGDEEKLKEGIATIGPISVAIDASHESFQFYSSGVYDEPNCSSEQLDHGVLAVGYGTTKEGHDYWLVKNSWGKTWGDGGYVKMTRNKNNQCGIASQASYPLV
ncbi:cathepsin L-like peptidase [Tachypleus tridentatus]|uniref:cathepsin L-like peptidase n=1 Tax=Tachypleus tridentatus TaxID=6853 RepID=UPI003FD5A5D8